MQYTFNFRSVWRYHDILVDGALLTLELSAATMVLGLLLGVLGSAMRTSSVALAVTRAR